MLAAVSEGVLFQGGFILVPWRGGQRKFSKKGEN